MKVESRTVYYVHTDDGRTLGPFNEKAYAEAYAAKLERQADEREYARRKELQ